MNPINWTLCLIADVGFLPPPGLYDAVRSAVSGGATMIQLRGKTCTTRRFLELALELKKITEESGIPLIINDRADVAAACDAQGVHLGRDDLPLEAARRILGKNKLIGLSVNTIEEARFAEYAGADYLGVGPAFYTTTKTDIKSVLRPEGLKIIRNSVKLPLLAIGGITEKNAAEAGASGMDGVAVISSVLKAENKKKAAGDIVEAFLRGKMMFSKSG
ncbi:MAG: thiamine phosphate synthase [Candidatus Aminicenantes bacterium]|nr:thiamine phosphate synthase [Candidatus Aminicenantes bacterium]